MNGLVRLGRIGIWELLGSPGLFSLRADDKSNDMVELGNLELAPHPPISHFREFTKYIPALPPPSLTIS